MRYLFRRVEKKRDKTSTGLSVDIVDDTDDVAGDAKCELDDSLWSKHVWSNAIIETLNCQFGHLEWLSLILTTHAQTKSYPVI